MKKILLADDSITIQKVVELTFSEGDYQVVCVSNGTQALRKLAEMRPDVILLDVIMPEKNGYEVCEEIKRNPTTSGIPVLLLTGTFEPFDKKRAEIAGAQGHLTKPFESQVLVGKVEELIAATPTVVSREEAGGMDVISGGDIYHVASGAPGEGMRPVGPPVRAGLSEHAAPDPAPGSPTIAPAAPPPLARGESEEPEWPHAVMEPPSAASGGSYVGFADLGVGIADEGQIVPDRYDGEAQGSPATVRVRREGQPTQGPGVPRGAGGRGENDRPQEPMEGYTGGFEMPGTSESAASMPRAADPEPAWAPPPEAPPAETWQTIDDDAMPGPAAAPTAPLSPAGERHRAADPAQDNGAAGLTPEAIDLIAERVVAKLSDRVVREIAWEVIPQVAESLVRRRIKELEEDKTG